MSDIENDDDSSITLTNDGSTKERRKIEIKFIENKTRRHVTFSKRKHGIMKKAFELSVLTGTQVLLLVVSETGLVYTFSTPKFEPIVTQQEGRNLIQDCLNAPDEEEEEEQEENQNEEGNENNSNNTNVSVVNENQSNTGLLNPKQVQPGLNLIPIKHDDDHSQNSLVQNVQYDPSSMAHQHMQNNPNGQANALPNHIQQQQQQQPGNNIQIHPHAQQQFNSAAPYFNAEHNAVYQQYF